jgi:hypothetical protein
MPILIIVTPLNGFLSILFLKTGTDYKINFFNERVSIVSR